VAQFSCEDAWAKRPVSANIDTSEENNESHAGIIRNPCSRSGDICKLSEILGHSSVAVRGPDALRSPVQVAENEPPSET
jgi:hypothetical protein